MWAKDRQNKVTEEDGQGRVQSHGHLRGTVLKVMEKLCFSPHKMREDFQQRSEEAWQTILKAAQAELKTEESVKVLVG